MLYIVPTPIGNLGDITYRAIEVLTRVELILAEDTRTTSILLKHYKVQKEITPYHQFNEHKVLQHLVEQLSGGKVMAIVTDAGTPGISDPAFLLVRECIKNKIKVECLPGATAFVPALINSGLPINSFVFEGFLPLKKGRQTMMKRIAEEVRTMIFYESPLRIIKTLDNLIEYVGEDRQCSVSRELTKIFEENTRGTLREVSDYYKKKNVKGEIVLILAGRKNY